MTFKPITIQKPSAREKSVLRLMIVTGVFAMFFFLYTLFHDSNVGYFPLYILLMITMLFYCLKFIHEWYHYFSISANEIPVTKKIYTVDILTTYCAGEPFEMLEETLVAVQNITYPHVTWCCDEADDPGVKALCKRLGVNHVTRTIKTNAKAGNINNALQFASGELIVVLDPDHIPCPEFLDYVVAYFDDPGIGFVQIVQAYYNQKESLVAKGAAQQTYQFYGPMMMCMNSYGTVQAIGANCTFRRAAIDSIGGHAAGLSEDMHTAMQLHAKGWRSIYVPSILTRGLVPATLSSYYKQQLKWSRGTWELLVVTYPKLFSKFTWRQKIHYLTLPFHYLSGVIFFINFLIPVVTLFTGHIPLKMDVFSFALASFPLFAMGVLIRHYVQKWVGEETERGFHIVGGILQIGTWWIHSVGLVYTFFRKKVPYIPTPKNDSDPLPLILNLPNIFIAVVSLAAIIYGLWNDYNPYTIFMVGLASIQVLFMLFILSISGYTAKYTTLNNIAKKIRSNTWLIIQTHGLLRRYSLALSVLAVSIFIFGYVKMQELPTFLPKPLPELEVFYTGLYQPDANSGLMKMGGPFKPGNDRQNNFSLFSFYIPWKEDTALPLDSLQFVYDNNAVPILHWGERMDDTSGSTNEAIFKDIVNGQLDTRLISMARQIASVHKPVFLKLALHQLGAPGTGPDLHIAAWRYVHSIFEKEGADQVVWIWNPPNAKSAADYFPGNKYVDWLGVNVLDYNLSKIDSGKNSFDSLYRPYHQSFLFKSGIPVMITAAGTLRENKTGWWQKAWNSIDTGFREIRSVVLYNSKTITYPNSAANKVEWLTGTEKLLLNSPINAALKKAGDLTVSPQNVPASLINLPDTIKGILYNKGFFWFRNRHTLMLKTIEADISDMKKIGINTIERTMPGFYDKSINRVVEKNKMNLIPRFWIPVSTEIIEDEKQMNREKDKILGVVKDNIKNKNIIAWNLGEDVLYRLENQTYKPDYFYYRNRYVQWLSGLCREIRLLDTSRPIVMDINWDVNGKKRLQFYKKYVPTVNKWLLVADGKNRRGLKDSLAPDMAWGKVPVEYWDSVPGIKKSGFIPAWQDIENTDYISLNGLLDLEGRKKQWYRKAFNLWSERTIAASPIPEIKILKPAKTTRENVKLVYHVMHKTDNNQWRLYKEDESGIRFEWYLVRIDQYGNTMFIKKAGEGASIALKIPEEPQYYHLYVEAVLGNDIKVAYSTLNTPLE